LQFQNLISDTTLDNFFVVKSWSDFPLHVLKTYIIFERKAGGKMPGKNTTAYLPFTSATRVGSGLASK